jgi:hypothetical protein
MIRFLWLLLAMAALPLRADDDAPPIIIKSPDSATTFAFGTIKHRALVWNDATQTLYAEVTFTDEQPDNLQAEDDSHRFRLPGVTLDKAKGVFYVTTPQGEAIPVARRKKSLFLSTIEVLPNAIVRVYHRHGDVSVTLEAIRPAEVANEKKRQDNATSSGTNPDGSHTVNLQDLFH